MVYLASSILTIQERLQHLCQRIDKHHNKSWMSVPEEKLLTSAEVRHKLAGVMRIILDNRPEFKEDGNQCGELILFFPKCVCMLICLTS